MGHIYFNIAPDLIVYDELVQVILMKSTTQSAL